MTFYMRSGIGKLTINMIKDGKIHLAKFGPPPAGLPVYQQADPRDVSFIGRTNYEAPGTIRHEVTSPERARRVLGESNQFVFGIRRKDRKRHVYIIGKTGVVTSKLS